jgi:hypothetical protein
VSPPVATVNLKYVTHIPKPGMRNPETGNVTLTNVFYQENKVGVWTLEIWDGDRKLLSQDFLLKK